MNRLNKLPATLLAVMLYTSAAQAMEIQKFDKMADPDQKEYVAELVDGAQKVLREQRRADLAEKVGQLFTARAPDSDISVGMSQFITNLALVRVTDLKRMEKDPNATKLEVEHAIILTLKHDGIVLPQTFMHVADNFHPKFPPKKN